MEELVLELFAQFPMPALFIVIAVFLFLLAKGADILVSEAVTLSVRWGVPKVIIGATIVSLGTTLPEAAVSVFAAVAGNPGLALGNAVGSIICNTGLVLGVASFFGVMPIEKKVVNRQDWIKVAIIFLLVIFSLPFGRFQTMFTEGSVLPQFVGFLFLIGLVGYIFFSIRIPAELSTDDDFEEVLDTDESKNLVVLVKLAAGIVLVVVSSRILIPAVQETAVRLKVPDSIIAATLVAFGTSLPELVTAITAVRKGHGEIALGNVIGANILNVLFVVGSASAVTRAGLQVQPDFFFLFYPAMLIMILIFRIGLFSRSGTFPRAFGFLLLFVYIATTILSYIAGVAPKH